MMGADDSMSPTAQAVEEQRSMDVREIVETIRDRAVKHHNDPNCRSTFSLCGNCGGSAVYQALKNWIDCTDACLAEMAL